MDWVSAANLTDAGSFLYAGRRLSHCGCECINGNPRVYFCCDGCSCQCMHCRATCAAQPPMPPTPPALPPYLPGATPLPPPPKPPWPPWVPSMRPMPPPPPPQTLCMGTAPPDCSTIYFGAFLLVNSWPSFCPASGRTAIAQGDGMGRTGSALIHRAWMRRGRSRSSSARLASELTWHMCANCAIDHG